MKTMKAISATKQAHATAGLFAARQASMSTYSSTKVLLLLLLAFVSALALATAQVATAAQTIQSYIDNEWPDERYTDHGDGTVTDNQTTLMWKQCSEGQSGSGCSTGTANIYTWQEALEQAKSVNTAGFATHSDWRVPNIKELQSLVAFDRDAPAINITVFPNTPSGGFWSASPHAYDGGSAWNVYFDDGNDYNNYHYESKRLRLVRGGQ